MTAHQLRVKLRTERWRHTLAKGMSLRKYEQTIWLIKQARKKEAADEALPFFLKRQAE
jgi:hypothetical protein